MLCGTLVSGNKSSFILVIHVLVVLDVVLRFEHKLYGQCLHGIRTSLCLMCHWTSIDSVVHRFLRVPVGEFGP
jgi:hypothetical protein